MSKKVFSYEKVVKGCFWDLPISIEVTVIDDKAKYHEAVFFFPKEEFDPIEHDVWYETDSYATKLPFEDIKDINDAVLDEMLDAFAFGEFNEDRFGTEFMCM